MVELSERRKRFRAALALTDKTQEDFAVTADVTPEHLSLVLHGKRDSAPLLEKIDAFIAKHLPSKQVA